MSKNSYQAALDEVVKTLETIDSGWKDIDKTILSASKNIRKISAKSLDSGLPKDVDDRIQKSIKERENILNAIERQRLAELKLQKDRENAFDKFEVQLKKEQAAREAQVKKESQLRVTLSKQKDKEFQSEARRLQQQAKGDALQIENQKILSRNAREAAILGSKLAGEYQKQEVVLNQLRRRYKDLAIAKSQNIKLSKEEINEMNRLEKEVVELEGKFKRVDASVGQFQRNVGNYSSAFKSLGGVIRSTMSAFGVMTGSFLAASIIKDGIARIREFDKEMQNMAGITRSSRADLKDLEKEIIDTASASVKTSNDIAKLATSLLTLGQTKEEVKLLLKPVTDLSIGLNTTAEEAGEFLIQSLNSFGKGAESAAEYADVIATVRTSTSLDFQKMRDSFQYLSPISRALGKDLAYTGAIIGILADNGLKAESAGRLLGTAQQKLAKQGMTLVEALDQINKAQEDGKTNLEVLALASNLFGAQAGKVGVILANNTDIIEENAQAIRDNSGALEDLTNEQLKSLDAQIKILDSSYEKFILTLDNGEGVITKMFHRAIFLGQDFFQTLTNINSSAAEFYEWGKSAAKMELGKGLKEDVDRLNINVEEAAKRKIPELTESLDKYNKKLAELTLKQREADDSYTIFGTISDGILSQNIKHTEKAIGKFEEMLALAREAAGLDPQRKEFVGPQLQQEQEEPFSIFGGAESSSNSQGMDDAIDKLRTYEDVLADISAAQKELQGSTADEAPAILYRIGVLQKEKEAWEQRGKAKKESSDTKVKDAFDLEKSRAERAIEIEKSITENKDLETDLRLEANQRFLDESLALLEIERVNAIKEAVGRKDAIQRINEEAETERLKLLYDSKEKVKEIYADSFNEKFTQLQKMQEGDAQSLEEEILNLKKAMFEKGATVQEVEDAVKEMRKDSLEKQLEDQIDFALKEVYVAAMTADERLLVEEELHKLKKKLLDEEFDAKKEYAAKEKELNQDLAESKREMYGELQNLAYDAVNGIFDAEVQKYDERIAENSDYYNALLENEGLTEDARADIEKKRIETDKKLQEKREQVEKRAFLINQGIKAAQIAIDTIQKVAAIKAQAAVLLSNPFTAALASVALAQIPFVIGTGAAAAGAVLAQSIPAFAKGKDENDPYEGPMLWGEKQAEVKRDKKGNIEVATKPTLGVTKKGDTIFPSIPSYLDSLNMDALNHAAIMTSLKSQSSNLDEKQTGQVLTDQIEKAIWKGYDKIKPQPIPAPDYTRLAIELAKEIDLNKKANV